MKRGFILLLIIFCFSCDENYVPKPRAYLRLDYPSQKYTKLNTNLPLAFETNLLATHITSNQVPASTKSYAVNIDYPSLKGSVFLTYKAIEGKEGNLRDFLKDAERFTLEHTKKADEISKYPYEDNQRKVYGLLSEVKGNVASPTQFYVTDSVNHFFTGSVYFNVKPNYDSILPAANYLQKDIMHIIETIQWK